MSRFNCKVVAATPISIEKVKNSYFLFYCIRNKTKIVEINELLLNEFLINYYYHYHVYAKNSTVDILYNIHSKKTIKWINT